MAASEQSRNKDARGFTLLEVLFALALMAIFMSAISQLSGTTALMASDIANLSNATQLVHSVVLDIEAEYEQEPFPTNDLEERDCELPDGFDRIFECTYDLRGLDVSSDNIMGAGEQAIESVTTSPLMSAICGSPGGGGPSLEPGQDPTAALSGMNVDSGRLGALVQLLNPEFMQMCGLNIAKLCQNTPMIASFIPTIIEHAAKVTRKLRVTIAWRDRGASRRELNIETFLTSLAEAEEDAGELGL